MGLRQSGWVRVGFRRVGQSSTGGGSINQVVGTAPIHVSGGTGPVVTVSHDASGVAANAYAFPSSLTVNGGGHITAITAGAAPVGSVAFTSPMENAGTPTAPNVRVKNTGNTAGRAAVPILLDFQSFAGQTTYTGPTWSAGAYLKLILDVRLTPALQAGTPCYLTFNGVTTGSYLGGITYCVGGGGPQGFGNGGFGVARGTGGILGLTSAAPAADASFNVEILPLVIAAGVNPAYFGRFTSKGAADGSYIFGYSGGEWESTGAITTLGLSFFGPSAGTVTLWGIPA